MTENKQYPSTFFFNQQPDDRWRIYDRLGLGDKLLTPEDLKESVLPHLDKIGLSVAEEAMYQSKVMLAHMDGFGVFKIVLRLYVKNDMISRTVLMSDTGQIISANIRQFRLDLPYFKGTPWPYTQEEMEEEIEASR